MRVWFLVSTVLLGQWAFGLSVSAADISGHWEGTLAGAGATTSVSLDIEQSDDGYSATYSMPEFRWMRSPFDQFDHKRGSISGEFSRYGGPKTVLECEVKRDSMSGEFTYRGTVMPIELMRAETPDVPYTQEEVEFSNGDVKLAGFLNIPKTPGPHPAIVTLHGSGDCSRWEYYDSGDFFARRGIAFLEIDKRGNGKSGGDWHDVGFNELAEDGIAGVHYLQTRKEIDPKRIGFWGISQAGWIMEIAALKSPDVAYFICVSGGTAKVEREGYYDYECDLRRKGYSEAQIRDAVELLRRNNEVTRGNLAYQEFLDYVQPRRSEPWYNELVFVPRPPESSGRIWYARIMDVDPAEMLPKIDIPALFLFGEADDSNPTAEGVELLNSLKSTLNKDWTIHVFSNADHGVRVPPPDGDPFPFRRHAPGYWESIDNWVRNRLVSGKP